MVKIILVTHGDMARAMLETAAKICSFEEGTIDVFTVSGNKVDLNVVAGGIKEKIDPQGTLILVDIFGGTSCNIASALTHGMPNVHVICGVNLNMLLAAINHRNNFSADELVKKVLEYGLKGVMNVTEKFK
jgi:mannose/fructose/sorbose-specific phosphotransferase system IIA component